jgi:uncharacterized RDD family membrane protein YckC
LSQEAPVQTVLACSQCGRALAQSDLVHIAGSWVCADCKPAFLSRVMASGAAGASPLAWHYGGFWIRFAARLIDWIILGIVQAFTALVFFGSFGAQFSPSVMQSASSGLRLGFQLLSFAIGIVYEVTFLRYRGATPGKMALGLKVVRSNGAPLGWGISVGRYFMQVVSTIILFIGFIMAGFDDEKRALHDRVCDTRVIYKQSVA